MKSSSNGAGASLFVAASLVTVLLNTATVHAESTGTSGVVSASISVVGIDLKSTGGKWRRFDFDSRTINLADLGNQIKTVIAAALIPAGQYETIRLVTSDTGQAVMQNGAARVLSIPSGPQTGIKAYLATPITINSSGALDPCLITFDIATSFILTGTGSFNFNPVVHGTVSEQPQNPDDGGGGEGPGEEIPTFLVAPEVIMAEGGFAY